MLVRVQVTAEKGSIAQMPGCPVVSQLFVSPTFLILMIASYLSFMTVFLHNCRLHDYTLIVPALALLHE